MTDEASDDRDPARKIPTMGLLGEFLSKGMPRRPGPPPRFLPMAPTFSYEKLEKMARKRNIEVGLPGWEDAVIWQAAAEHKELNPDGRSRGRPKTPQKGGLLSAKTLLPSQIRDDQVRAKIEKIIADVERRQGGACSAAEAARIYVRHTRGEDAEFASNVQVVENQVSRSRKRRPSNLA